MELLQTPQPARPAGDRCRADRADAEAQRDARRVPRAPPRARASRSSGRRSTSACARRRRSSAASGCRSSPGSPSRRAAREGGPAGDDPRPAGRLRRGGSPAADEPRVRQRRPRRAGDHGDERRRARGQVDDDREPRGRPRALGAQRRPRRSRSPSARPREVLRPPGAARGSPTSILERADLEATLAPIRLPVPASRLARHERLRRRGRADERAPDGAAPRQPGRARRHAGARTRARRACGPPTTTSCVDAAPLLSVGDSMTLSARVDAILVVTRLGIVNRPMLTDLSRELDAQPGEQARLRRHGGRRQGRLRLRLRPDPVPAMPERQPQVERGRSRRVRPRRSARRAAGS